MSAMLITNFTLGSILVLSITPSIIFTYYTRNWVRNINRNMSRSNSALNSRLNEFLSGLDVIRIHGLESWSQREFQENVDDYRNSHLKANGLYAWSRPLTSFLCGLPLVGLIWFGGSRVLEGTMAVGLFVTFVRYCERFLNPIITLSREVHVIQQALTSSERVASFLSHTTENTTLGPDGHLTSKERLQGKLEFKNIWMRYEDSDKWILKDLSFSIRPGEKIGLVGRTGCGKSSTVNLLTRLYEYQRGDILLDDHPLRSYKRNFLRDQIGFVPKRPLSFKEACEKISPQEKMPPTIKSSPPPRPRDYLKSCKKTNTTSTPSSSIQATTSASANDK